MRNQNRIRNREQSKNISRRAAYFGVFAALTLSLSFVESLVPGLAFLPVGAKLGLANVVIMTAACTLGAPYAIAIAVMKGLFAFVTRGFTAMLMSLFASLVSCVAVCLLLRIKILSERYILISAAGAVCHNLTQLVVCVLLMSDAKIFVYAPALVLFGIIAGIITGSIVKLISIKGFGIIKSSPQASKAETEEE